MIRLALILSIALQSGLAFARDEKEPFGMLTVDEVSKRLTEKDVFIFDANPDSVYAEHHVPGARHVKFLDVSEKTLPKNRDATLIFYCKNPH